MNTTSPPAGVSAAPPAPPGAPPTEPPLVGRYLYITWGVAAVAIVLLTKIIGTIVSTFFYYLTALIIVAAIVPITLHITHSPHSVRTSILEKCDYVMGLFTSLKRILD